MPVVLSRTSSKDAARLNSLKTAHYPDGQESWMNSILRSLTLIGVKLHRFSSTVHLSELVYVFLRQQQMKRSLQAHKSRYAAKKSSAVHGCRIPKRRGLLEMFDISKDLLGVSLIQIDTIARRQILLIKIAIGRPCFRGNKYDVSQDIRQRVASRSQTRDLDLFFACLPVPDECMTVGCCRAGTKINVIGTSGRSSLNWLYI